MTSAPRRPVGRYCPARQWFAAVALASAAMAHGGEPVLPNDPDTAGLLPMGAMSAGDTTLSADSAGDVFRFTYTGPDETLTYRIDTTDPEVAGGVIEVLEETTGVQPVATGGIGYRKADGTVRSAAWLAQFSSLASIDVDGDTLSLTYADAVPGEDTRNRRYTFELVGKALRIRCLDLDADTAGTSNYADFAFGPVKSARSPRDLKLPYMISTPLAVFTSQVTGEKAYVTTQVDWSVSNGTGWSQPFTHDAVIVDGDSIANSYQVRYPVNSNGELNAPVDETVWVLVTQVLEDTFPETEAHPSPYRELLFERPTVLFGSNIQSWANYQTLINLYRDWGMAHMAVYSFFHWSTHAIDTGGNQKAIHVWVPAREEPDFIDLAGTMSDAGYLHGVYTLWHANSSQPFFDPDDGIFRSDGRLTSKISPLRQLSHADREESEIKQRYDTSLGFMDVLGTGHPALDVDFDASVADKSKTIAETLADQRRVFQQTKSIHNGPQLSEGSIATIGSNYELHYAGFVDSVEATINTGSTQKASALADDDPLAPENWWVMPDYALRVFNRTQANHGNAFYDRFFNHDPEDPSLFPLDEADIDSYRIYEITYGHTGFFQTNGPIDGPGNHMTFANYIEEYYAMQALQKAYFSARIETVEYWISDAFVTADELIKTSTAANPLDDFRDARIRLTYANGLVIYLNHGPADWADIELAGKTFVLPEDGYVAYRPDTGLLAFSAIPDDVEPASSRIDYVMAPDRYELLDGRGTVAAYAGLAPPLVAADASDNLLVHNLVAGDLIRETRTGEITVESIAVPTLTAIDLQGPDTYALGEQALLRPVADYDNGARDTLSPRLGNWVVDVPGIATVDEAGVARAIDDGMTEVRFVLGGIESAPLVIRSGDADSIFDDSFE